MAEIARRAGVVRATIYMHFPTRDSLLDAVMDLGIVAAAVDPASTRRRRGHRRGWPAGRVASSAPPRPSQDGG
jgi:AcrR family transcriptional regulator